jgi:hypothetical protein
MTFCSLDGMDRFGLFDFQRFYVNYFRVFLTFDYYWFHLFPAASTFFLMVQLIIHLTYLRFNCRLSRDRYGRPVGPKYEVRRAWYLLGQRASRQHARRTQESSVRRR